METRRAQNHTIRKQSIEINFETVSDGFALQTKASELFYEKLLPGMELLFDEFSDERQFISFDTLNVDCGILSAKHWEDEWISETLRQLRAELLAAQKKEIGSSVTEEEKLEELFLFYVKHGYLPWNSYVVSMSEFESVILKGAGMSKLKLLIQEDPKATRRLVNTFSDVFLRKIIQQLVEERKAEFAGIASMLDSPSAREEKRNLQAGWLEVLCDERIEIPSTSGNVIPKDKKQSQMQTSDASKERKPLGQESIYISNAGLIILHPFFQQLFETCGLMKEKKWIDEKTSQQTAFLMLEYLVQGSEDTSTLNTVLTKILCGLEVDEPIPKDEGLAEDVKKECDRLLGEVIGHWKVLKNTGNPAFRETFLQRSGKLTPVEGGWLLQVEQKSFDILLGHLPWGIGTIRLHWMTGILYTEW